MASTASAPSALEGFTPAQLADLVQPSDRYHVLSAAQSQEVDGQNLVDVLEFTFALTGRPGVFTARLPLTGSVLIAAGAVYVPGTGAGYDPATYAAVGAGIDLAPYADTVERIYELTT